MLAASEYAETRADHFVSRRGKQGGNADVGSMLSRSGVGPPTSGGVGGWSSVEVEVADGLHVVVEVGAASRRCIPVAGWMPTVI